MPSSYDVFIGKNNQWAPAEYASVDPYAPPAKGVLSIFGQADGSASATEYKVSAKTTGTANYQITYVGNWSIGATDYYTNVAGAKGTIVGKGRRVRLYGVTDSNSGIMAITFDGTVTQVDLYSSTRRENALLFDSGLVTDSVHTLSWENTGNRNIASGGLFVNAGTISFDIVGVLPVVSPGEIPPITTRPVKLLPMGDSITDGYNGAGYDGSGGYRIPLGLKWDAGVIQYVGSLSNGPAGMRGGNAHEGRTGWSIAGDPQAGENLQDIVAARLTTYNPDILLFMAGTNDVTQTTVTMTVIADRLRTFLNTVFATKPTLTVVVSTIPAMYDADYANFNALVPGVVNEFRDAGRKIVLADAGNAGLTYPDDFRPAGSDHVHPDASGYEKIANAMYAALSPLIVAAPVVGTRDVTKHPYRGSWTAGAPSGTWSIWNTPIGSGAQLVSSNIGLSNAASGKVTSDAMWMGKASDPVKTLTSPDVRLPAGFSKQVRVPASATGPGNYTGGNNIAAFPEQNDPTKLWCGHPLSLVAGGNPSWAYQNPVLVPDDLYGIGNTGSHGGSHMSGNSCIKLEEWNASNHDSIQHAIPVNIYGLYMSYTNIAAQLGGLGYRWPANSTDSYASSGYKGSNTAVKMGTLLTLPANYDWASISNPKTKKLLWNLWAFGWYVVDDSAWNVINLGHERGIDINGQDMTTFHTPILQALMQTLVVNNNLPTSVGGGGTPRVPLISDVVRP